MSSERGIKYLLCGYGAYTQNITFIHFLEAWGDSADIARSVRCQIIRHTFGRGAGGIYRVYRRAIICFYSAARCGKRAHNMKKSTYRLKFFRGDIGMVFYKNSAHKARGGGKVSGKPKGAHTARVAWKLYVG